MSTPDDVRASVAAVRERISDAARRAGRDAASVTLVAATKTVDVERVRAVIEAGVVDVGENRAQELLAKAPECVDLPARWHFLGQLQRNKVRTLAAHVECWQSVDRLALGDEIARRAPGTRVLVEVNLGDEPQKGGCSPEAAPALVDALAERDLRVVGLMTVPPRGDDPRPWFAALRGMAGRLGLPELSMGMSDDYEAAVEEGATMVRVGRALFGGRPGVGT
ncbi:MAG TPA: YggS family pyridoxal phosphate-dependent enzyme [Acidimicrobiia bacterium]|nr:YggS family pyridoxal phosphate-dependent enzyme [Acidimicrobiia bacterium]